MPLSTEKLKAVRQHVCPSTVVRCCEQGISPLCDCVCVHMCIHNSKQQQKFLPFGYGMFHWEIPYPTPLASRPKQQRIIESNPAVITNHGGSNTGRPMSLPQLWPLGLPGRRRLPLMFSSLKLARSPEDIWSTEVSSLTHKNSFTLVVFTFAVLLLYLCPVLPVLLAVLYLCLEYVDTLCIYVCITSVH